MHPGLRKTFNMPEIASNLSGRGLRVAIVRGRFNERVGAAMLAASGRFHALVALGAVIRGETYHFEIVSNESAAGIMQVQLDTGVPIANGILTTENDEQADVRSTVKGAECAEAAVEMANFSAAASKSMPSKLPS